MGAEAAVNAVFANKIADKPEAERAAYVEQLREEYRADIDLLKLASNLHVDAVVPGRRPARRADPAVRRRGGQERHRLRAPPFRAAGVDSVRSMRAHGEAGVAHLDSAGRGAPHPGRHAAGRRENVSRSAPRSDACSRRRSRRPPIFPAERRAVMDGYAVRGADVRGASALSPVVLAVTGTVPMGDVFPRGVGAGEAVAIATGGFLPEGADAVVMVEHTTRAGRRRPRRGLARGGAGRERGGARRGSARGAAVLPAGRRLRPQDLAMLATFGVTTVDVHRRPRVAVLSTGNELCRSRRDAASGPGARRQPDRAGRAGDRRRLRRHVRRHRPGRRRPRCGARSPGCSTTTTPSSCRAARRSGRKTCRPTRWPTSIRPASCSTASTSVPASPPCSRARAASRSWACPGFPPRR